MVGRSDSSASLTRFCVYLHVANVASSLRMLVNVLAKALRKCYKLPPLRPNLLGMSAVDVDCAMTSEHPPKPAVLQNLFSYPFMSCLVERRTRRIARGTSVNAGSLSYVSSNQPAPLSKLEEAILIVSTGITGVVTHDGPTFRSNGKPELATPFLNVVARSASSVDNSQATSFFMINDEGICLLRHPKGIQAAELKDLPPRWSDWSEGDWIAAAEKVKVRVSDRRVEFPRDYPYYVSWNKLISNVPGTTLFLPVVDCTWQYINILLILLSEPDGCRPLMIDDFRRFHPKSFLETLVWAAGKLGLTRRIPYHLIGGLKWVRNGFASRNNPLPLGFGRALRTDYESLFALQNLMLAGQAMGLGAWIHSSVMPPYIYQRDPSKDWWGLGFRMVEPKRLRPMPPVPASQPNPVGIDGILEGLCPPYVKSMSEAIDRVLEAKYGARGAYGDLSVFSLPYVDRRSTFFGAGDRLYAGDLRIHLRDLRPFSCARRCVLYPRSLGAVFPP